MSTPCNCLADVDLPRTRFYCRDVGETLVKLNPMQDDGIFWNLADG